MKIVLNSFVSARLNDHLAVRQDVDETNPQWYYSTAENIVPFLSSKAFHSADTSMLLRVDGEVNLCG